MCEVVYILHDICVVGIFKSAGALPALELALTSHDQGEVALHSSKICYTLWFASSTHTTPWWIWRIAGLDKLCFTFPWPQPYWTVMASIPQEVLWTRGYPVRLSFLIHYMAIATALKYCVQNNFLCKCVTIIFIIFASKTPIHRGTLNGFYEQVPLYH